MKPFKPCQGKHACRDDGERCLACGRTLDEITRLRNLIDQLSSFAIDFGYENVEEFTRYIEKKVSASITYRRQQDAPVTVFK